MSLGKTISNKAYEISTLGVVWGSVLSRHRMTETLRGGERD